MGHQFDDFLKHKLEQREFEFKDAYWADALDLIEAEEKDNRWRFLLWILLGLFAVSATGFIASQWYAQPETHITDNQSNISTSNPNTSINKTTPVQENSLISITNDIDNSIHKNINELNTTAKVKDLTPETNIERTIPKHVNTRTREYTTQTTDATTINHKSGHQSTTGIAIAASNFPIDRDTANASSITDISTDKTSKSDTKKSISEVSHKPTDTKQTTAPVAPTKALDTVTDFLDNTPKLTTENIDKLMQGNLGFPTLENSITLSSPFSMGARGSSLLYLSLGGQIGYTFGLTGKYNINPNWAIGTDLLYHIRRHQFSTIDQNTIVDYSFGRTESNELLRPSALHSVELPIYAEYGFGNKTTNDFSERERYNKHSIELGIAPIYLYGTKGVVATGDSGDVLQEGWIQTEAYRSFYANGLVGYNYYMKDYLSLGIRARYAIGGIIDESFQVPAGVPISQPDKLYFDINAKFYLF